MVVFINPPSPLRECSLSRSLNCSSFVFFLRDRLTKYPLYLQAQVEDMMVEINADKEEAEVVRVKVEAEEAVANEKVGTGSLGFRRRFRFLHLRN